MLYKLLIFITYILVISACSSKIPNTWNERIIKHPINYKKLHVDISGSGKPIVLLHGFGSNSYSFNKIIKPLSKKYKVYNFDLKGFGKSPKPNDNRYSVYDQAILIEKYINKHHLNHISIIGHSYGGGVALCIALLNQKNIDHLVLIDAAAYKQQLPSLIKKTTIPIFGPLAFYLLPSSYEIGQSYLYAFYNKNHIDTKITRNLTKNLNKPNAKLAFLSAINDLIPYDIDIISKKYKSIKIPTLIIWGENDIVIRKKNAFRLHYDIQNSKLKIIKHCGHIPHEERPKKTVKYILDFLSI